MLEETNLTPEPRPGRKYLVAGAVLAVAAAAALVWYYRSPEPAAPVSETQQYREEAVPGTVTETPKDKLPEAFPAGIPLEQGATVEQNYSIIAGDDQGTQATRSFVSARGADENFRLYAQFFSTAKGWTVLASSSEGTVKLVTARNGSTTVDVAIQPAAASPAGSVVGITAVTK